MHQTLDRCLCCGAGELSTFADLGEQPLANDFHPPGEECQRHPLAVSACPRCFHSQLTVSVDRAALFREYPYVSGTTRTLDDYFGWFAGHVSCRHGGPGRVLDIGCNDGSQLVRFVELGWETAGVDPAENIDLRPEARARLHRGFWSAEAAEHLPGPFDAVVAQNVVAHVSNPAIFLALCRRVLAPGGRVYVQTSQADMIERREFDTIYHEHVSYFSARSLATLARRCGFVVPNARKTPIHGDSYLFELQDAAAANEKPEEDGELTRLIAAEETAGRYSPANYRSFSRDMEERARAVREALERYRSEGFRAVGYGAAAKANTFLNYSGLALELIVDDNPRKQGLLTPGGDVPVHGPEALAEIPGRLVVVALAWNFFDEIGERLQPVRGGRGDRLLRYFPALEVRPLDDGAL